MMGLNGCNTSRPDHKDTKDTMQVQDGWTDVPLVGRVAKVVTIPNRMSRDCKYDRILVDDGCIGCEVRTEKEKLYPCNTQKGGREDICKYLRTVIDEGCVGCANKENRDRWKGGLK